MSPTIVSRDLYHIEINLTHFRVVHLEIIQDYVGTLYQRNVKITSTLQSHLLPLKRVKAQGLLLNLVGK